MNKIISRGAEAILYIEDGQLVKERVKKGYRIKEIDDKLRKQRTKSEARLLEKAISAVNVPSIYYYDSERNMRIVMSYIEGKLVKNILDDLGDKELKKVCMQIGDQIAGLHFSNIFHGDLTTSNMIINEHNNKVYLIDFGLGFISERIEDKAVDLKLLRQALESKHYKVAENAFRYILEGYRNRFNYTQADDVIRRLREKVEKRGRYKRKAKTFKNS